MNKSSSTNAPRLRPIGPGEQAAVTIGYYIVVVRINEQPHQLDDEQPTLKEAIDLADAQGVSNEPAQVYDHSGHKLYPPEEVVPTN
jgi:hypothetical protein